MHYFLYGIYPYIALTVLVVGSIARYERDPYTWKSSSSQLLRRKQLIWGSILFHVGVLSIFAGHLVGLLTPLAFWDAIGVAHSTKQMIAIVLGGTAGIMMLTGGLMLAHRRLFDARVRASSSFADTAILLLLVTQVILGLMTILVSLGHMDGHEMTKFMAWAQGIFTFDSKAASYIEDTNILFRIHIFVGLTIFLVFPFTRLVHMLSVPIRYIWRGGYQIVRTRKREKPVSAVAKDITVNGEEISSAAIAAETQNHNAPANKPGEAWRTAARALVIRALLLQEAKQFGLTADPEMLGKDKRETEEEALIRAVLDEELVAPDVSEADCRLIYDRQTDVFVSPSLFQPAHILFAAKPEDKEKRESAKKHAQELIKAIQKSPKSFAHIAKENSECPSKSTGGELGQIGTGDTVPEFETVLDSLAAGELHPEPVETRFGVHIVRMDEKIDGKILPFEAVEPQIREKLEQVAWAKGAKALTQKLIAQADIKGIEINSTSPDIH